MSTKAESPVAAATRVVLVSSRPMFRRSFGKVLAALREGLSTVEAASLDDVAASIDEGDGAALVMLDGGGKDATALADGVVSARALPAVAGVVVVLDESDDALTDAAMAAGARGVVLKSVPPGVMAEWLDALLDGESVRPAPSVTLGPEVLTEALRARLSARRQKLLRLQMGGASIAETARTLDITPAKVVGEMRAVMDIVRGRDADP